MLYKRHYGGIYFLCMDYKTTTKVIKKVHARIKDPHMNGYMLAKKLLRLVYFQSIMEANYNTYIKRCHKYQIYGKL